MYNDTFLKAGHLALQGLKQSHLQLIFRKECVIELAGKEIIDIGFETEIPGYGFEKPKAQFQYKTHQEYLAAYFIIFAFVINRNYRVLIGVCVCVSVYLCVCLAVQLSVCL